VLSDGLLLGAVRRILDVVVSLTALVIAAPLMLLIAGIIAIDSPGPALFSQGRVARGGGEFRFWKFRTMVVDARERFPELYSYSYDQD
jgi:lipopolysaccharide/colanic/teichoic acid biosynthesis glycosyltransferase